MFDDLMPKSETLNLQEIPKPLPLSITDMYIKDEGLKR